MSYFFIERTRSDEETQSKAAAPLDGEQLAEVVRASGQETCLVVHLGGDPETDPRLAGEITGMLLQGQTQV